MQSHSLRVLTTSVSISFSLCLFSFDVNGTRPNLLFPGWDSTFRKVKISRNVSDPLELRLICRRIGLAHSKLFHLKCIGLFELNGRFSLLECIVAIDSFFVHNWISLRLFYAKSLEKFVQFFFATLTCLLNCSCQEFKHFVITGICWNGHVGFL